MNRIVKYNDIEIEYTLERKAVKNINMRIKPDCSVYVSANKRISLKYIDDFVLRKGDFILSAFDKFKNNSQTNIEPRYSEQEFITLVLKYFDDVYEKFSYKINRKPELKFKNMKSRWGSCNYVKYIIALSTNLIYCTEEQIYYVIVHEFAHFIEQNHSKNFYSVVEKYCKDYKRINKELNNIILR